MRYDSKTFELSNNSDAAPERSERHIFIPPVTSRIAETARTRQKPSDVYWKTQKLNMGNKHMAYLIWCFSDRAS